MQHPALFGTPVHTVTELTRYLRDLLENDEILQDAWVTGEISNLARPQSGHLYFTLKDENASLRAVIWKMQALRMHIQFQGGQRVEVHGAISLYEPRGEYQIIVDTLRPAGEGLLFHEFIRLKSRLEAEGLFDPERKKDIPARPKRIGIVTSPSGAALQDILNTLGQRYPLAEVILAPSAVQGVDAPGKMIKALKRLYPHHPDVIIIARGGGSLEDLWAFNDESFVRSIAECPFPVIAGIGHETDFTLADFVADLRAPTPTGAAVLITPEIEEVLMEIKGSQYQLSAAFNLRLQNMKAGLKGAFQNLTFNSPQRSIQTRIQFLDGLTVKLHSGIRHRLELFKANQRNSIFRLANLNPLVILQRGYAVVYAEDGTIIRQIEQVHLHDKVHIRISDGELGAQILALAEQDKDSILYRKDDPV